MFFFRLACGCSDCQNELLELPARVWAPMWVTHDYLNLSLVSLEIPRFWWRLQGDIWAIISNYGKVMIAEVWRDGPKPTDKQSFFQRRGRTLLTAVSGIFTVAGFITHAAPAGSIQQEYSFVAERGYVQPEVYREYGGILKTHLHSHGFASPEAGTRSMLHNSVVY